MGDHYCQYCFNSGFYIDPDDNGFPPAAIRCKCNGGKEFGHGPGTEPKIERPVREVFSHVDATQKDD